MMGAPRDLAPPKIVANATSAASRPVPKCSKPIGMADDLTQNGTRSAFPVVANARQLDEHEFAAPEPGHVPDVPDDGLKPIDSPPKPAGRNPTTVAK